MTVRLLITALCLFVVTVSGCKRSSTSTTPSAQSPPASQPSDHHAEGGSTIVTETKYFKGSIGNNLDLQMKLIKTGELITGHYSYQKIGTRISLRGNVDKDGNVVLHEFDPTGKQTGEFKGVWTVNSEEGRIKIGGNWTNPQGEKGSERLTAFSLKEEPIFFSGDVEIINKQIKESNKKLMFEIDANYPQITGGSNPNVEKLNQVLQSVVTRKVTDFRKEMVPKEDEEPRPAGSMGSDINVAYSIALAQDDLVSIEFDVGSYYQGAAHPNSYTEVVNYDLKNGKQLKLGDLFKSGSKYLQAIANYCIEDLNKQTKAKGPASMLEESSIRSGAAPAPKNYESWMITRNGLGINFDSYQVAPYAAGPQFVMVPYSALKEHVNPDGPLWQFVKS